jgi:gamma-glutamylcyclotransferase (GGCT)/AIG2-like uncharacterized protein YtfP
MVKAKFIFYGKLKSNEILNFIIPKKNSTKQNIKLKGFKMYSLKNSVGVIKTNKKDIIECELWTLNISKLRLKLLLFILDLIEGTHIKKYKRIPITYSCEKAWIYIYNKKIDPNKEKNFLI